MDQPAPPVPPGWHPDPGNPGGAVRWWDGARWTEHVHPVQPAGTAPVVQPWVPQKATTTPDGVPLAALGARFVARLVDSIALAIAQFAVIAPFVPAALRDMVDYLDAHQADIEQGGFNPYQLYAQPGVIRLLLVAVVASVALSALYTVTFVHLRGATPGKLMLGVRVRPWEVEGRPSWGQATQRWATGELASSIVGIYGLIDWLWPCWDERKQALHDKWPRTVVVTGRRP